MPDPKESTYTWCEHDYKNHHFWERIGIASKEDRYYEVFRCTQCEKCYASELVFIEGYEIA